jgi:hypothetical protein
VWPSSFLSGVSSLPCSTETQWALSFWPLCPLVRRAMAMLCPVCFCTVKDRRRVRMDLRREGVRWYSCRYPRHCRGMDHRGGMTGVMLDHSVAPILPSTMYGRVHPISGNGCCGGGPRGSRPFLEGPTRPLGEVKVCQGG